MNPKEVNERLTQYVRPLTFPLAVKLITSDEELPERVRIPSVNLGIRIPLCQGVGMARRQGWVVALGRDDINCAGPALALGFVKPDEITSPPPGFDPQSMAPRLEFGKYRYILFAPLQYTTFEPDALALYGNSAQIMRLVQAAGRNSNAIATGGGDCIEIATAGDDERTRVVLVGGGDRVYGTAQDDEMIFTSPWGKVEEVLNGLEMTHKAGFRYPVITYNSYEPVLPPFLNLRKMMGQD